MQTRKLFYISNLEMSVSICFMSLKRKILEKLKEHTEINTSGVKVMILEGKIELHGHVDGPNARATIEAIVRGGFDDADVINYLTIREHSTTGTQGIRIT